MSNWILANFNMHKTSDECIKYAKEFKKLVKKCNNNIAVCPSFVCINEMAKVFKGTNVKVGAQNCSTDEKGAFTGEISVEMLKSVGASLVIVGHSERRTKFGETDQIVNQKIKMIQQCGLTPVVCLADDGSKGYEKNIKKQIQTLFNDVNKNAQIIIAFEPLWAIGTGKTMDSENIRQVVDVIKKEAKAVLGKDVSVLYGGSAKVSNAKELLAIENVDGLLVGGASLDAKGFSSMCFAF